MRIVFRRLRPIGWVRRGCVVTGVGTNPFRESASGQDDDVDRGFCASMDGCGDAPPVTADQSGRQEARDMTPRASCGDDTAGRARGWRAGHAVDENQREGVTVWAAQVPRSWSVRAGSHDDDNPEQGLDNGVATAR